MALTVLAKPLRHTPGQLVAGWLPSGSSPRCPLKEVVGAPCPGRWVEHPNYWAVACDYCDGKRVPFGRTGAPRARIADAVAGLLRHSRLLPARQDRRAPYVDGGVCSPSNLDLVAGRGLDLVICLNPMSSSSGRPRSSRSTGRRPRAGARRPAPAHEERKVRRFGTQVLRSSRPPRITPSWAST